MKFFGLFGGASQKTVDDLLDSEKGLVAKAGAWVGNQAFTSEEQAEHNAKIAEGVRQFVVDTLSENTDRSLARREIAKMVIRAYLLLVFWCAAVFPYDREWSAMIFSLITDVTLAGLVISISIFFYGSHAVQKYQKQK